MNGYVREERWVPITEMGDRWAPRSREEAEKAMRETPVGGKWLTGEEWDGIERIDREVRYVTEWTEEPATDPRLADHTPRAEQGGES